MELNKALNARNILNRIEEYKEILKVTKLEGIRLVGYDIDKSKIPSINSFNPALDQELINSLKEIVENRISEFENALELL